jgi:hypothetical protein
VTVCTDFCLLLLCSALVSATRRSHHNLQSTALRACSDVCLCSNRPATPTLSPEMTRRVSSLPFSVTREEESYVPFALCLRETISDLQEADSGDPMLAEDRLRVLERTSTTSRSCVLLNAIRLSWSFLADHSRLSFAGRPRHSTVHGRVQGVQVLQVWKDVSNPSSSQRSPSPPVEPSLWTLLFSATFAEPFEPLRVRE